MKVSDAVFARLFGRAVTILGTFGDKARVRFVHTKPGEEKGHFNISWFFLREF